VAHRGPFMNTRSKMLKPYHSHLCRGESHEHLREASVAPGAAEAQEAQEASWLSMYWLDGPLRQPGQDSRWPLSSLPSRVTNV
jgi:hypothetical protein